MNEYLNFKLNKSLSFYYVCRFLWYIASFSHTLKVTQKEQEDKEAEELWYPSKILAMSSQDVFTPFPETRSQHFVFLKGL